MSLDLKLLGGKLRRYRTQLQLDVAEVAAATGISTALINQTEAGTRRPTGDELLILSDFYNCDYKFFISNERLAPFEQTEELYRKHGESFTKEDRRNVQEFLFLCECEQQLMIDLNRVPPKTFAVSKIGRNYKAQGVAAAAALRRHLGFSTTHVSRDVYADGRSLGLHVFRRRLGNSAISGLCLIHPIAGRCVLVNYDEDPFRQRFSVAHEIGHALLDDGQDVTVSLSRWGHKDLSEIRANTFASEYLAPSEFLRQIPEPHNWTAERLISWAARMMVNASVLALALQRCRLIDVTQAQALRGSTVPPGMKSDVELSENMAPKLLQQRKHWLEKGLSSQYVNLCFDAYREAVISRGRLAEMLLITDAQLSEVAVVFGRNVAYDD